MNKFFTLLVFLALNGLLIGTSVAGDSTCFKTGDAITTVSGNSATPVGSLEDSTADSCNDVPDAYKIALHMMALCKDDPSLLDFSTCQYMLSPTDTAIDHTINFPAFGALAIPAFSILPGTYNYMVSILSNKIGIKHTITTTNTTTGASSSTGTTCWTSNAGPSGIANDEEDTPHGTTIAASTQMITCGAAADAAPIFSYEIINNLSNRDCDTDDDGTVNAYATNGDRQDMGIIGNGTAYASLLQSNTAMADDCEDADRLLWTIALTAPAVVKPTSSFNLQMRTQDSVSVDFSGSSDTNIMKMGADPLQAFFEVID
jgi:hypothetical protein|tara:strand:- start:303 stop:1250 length:948 start_codon:yes stop_codon:yes gene_type:complete